MDQIEAYYDEVGFSDWTHAESGAKVVKAQHPEFEMWSQGIHARSGVSCADCHMPYKREGAIKISEHHIRSPLLNIARSCQGCHPYGENEITARALTIQKRHQGLQQRAESAVVDLIEGIKAARAGGASEESLDAARKLQRRAQWRVDFVNAENSMGFHAPQEAARILGEAIDYARQGMVSLAPGPSAQGGRAEGSAPRQDPAGTP
jgi:nitrite reductase (cytochrome c-552)